VPPAAGRPLPAPGNGRFAQFAQPAATLSAPVATDATAGGQWPPNGTQVNQSTGGYPAYGADQEQSAYQGAPGQDMAGGTAGGMNGYQTAATGGQPAAPTPANSYAYTEAAYPANGNTPNGHSGDGYGNGGYLGTGAYPAPGYAAGTGAFPVNSQHANYSADGYGPTPSAPQSAGRPTFTPTFTPNGAASPAGTPNGNGRSAGLGQAVPGPSGAYPGISAYPAARGGGGEQDQSYQPAPGYPSGTGYPSGLQPKWPDGYAAAAQWPGPGYPAGPAQGYQEYADQAAHAANGYQVGQQTGPLAAADRPSSPGYAPPDQFDPSQQGYWQ